MRPGDTLVVASLYEALDTNTPGGRLVSHAFAALAEFKRRLISEVSKRTWRQLGRTPALMPEQVRHTRGPLARLENSVSSVARLLDVLRFHGLRGSGRTSGLTDLGSVDGGQSWVQPSPTRVRNAHRA